MPMELVAFGFNASGQLQESVPVGSGKGRDIHYPRVIDEGVEEIKVLFAGLTDIVYEIDGHIRVQGTSCKSDSFIGFGPDYIVQVAGDASGPRYVVCTDGSLMRPVRDADGRVDEWEFVDIPGVTNVRHIAVAGNGTVCLVDGLCTIKKIVDYQDGSVPMVMKEWDLVTMEITQLVANETSHACLTQDGAVYTWGDRRFGLGRAVEDDLDAEEPGQVGHLARCEVKKLAAGGWSMAALCHQRPLAWSSTRAYFTKPGTVFIWGREEPGHIPGHLFNINSSPIGDLLGVGLVTPEDMYIVDDFDEEVNGKEIVNPEIIDIAGGDGHFVFLTKNHNVLTLGRNSNGQTGRPDQGEFQRDVLQIERAWNGKVEGVYSGSSAWHTLLLTKS